MLTDTNSLLYKYPEVWGGIECTISRVKDNFFDQLEANGHYTRESDIKQIAGLGIKAIRYPVLWEFHDKGPGKEVDWSWTEKQLKEITDHHITPIAGLVHHGNGPDFTNLYDENFPELLAQYAKKVALNFPWIEYYTPVNEPLTTARFCGLYGHWYPHHTNDYSFLRILLNQIKGIILSMSEIRKINPEAKLVQTEDLASIHSTESLTYQANFENERRWLTFDLLLGRVDSTHPLYNYFIDSGITETELEFFIHNALSPDIAGLNYYVTSERYLDDNISRYPAHLHGKNKHHQYVDIEAVRHEDAIPNGIESLLITASQRYSLPLAITEVHLNCTREYQMRWLNEIWEGACNALRKGVNLRAVTVWSLLGAYNWSNLLTRDDNEYESGAFDTRDQNCRPTALCKMIKSLAETGSYKHPVLNENGWWNKLSSDQVSQEPLNLPGLLIIGKHGTLAQAFATICLQRKISFTALSRTEINITDPVDIDRIINIYKPWAIINTSGYVRVDDAETEEETCFQLNAVAPGLLSAACKKYGIQFMSFSSDLIFNGKKASPYTEEDIANPLNVYGKSKMEGEKLMISNYSSSLIIRTSAFFGPWDRYNFVYYILDSLNRKHHPEVANDIIISPTYVPDLVNSSLDLLIDEETGIWHLTNDGIISWADFAASIAERSGHKMRSLNSRKSQDMEWAAKRPLYSALKSNKGRLLPSFEHALDRCFEEKNF